MVPYTPRAKTPGRRKLTLSAKEYKKITNTIASVRRNRQRLDDEYSRDENASTRQHDYEVSSFIAETSFVRAPLNSRVVSNGLTSNYKGKCKQEDLSHIPLEVQEAMILEDLLYVLTGIEGTYVTYHPDYSPEDDDPFQGIPFVVSSSLDGSIRDLVERILPLATYYTAVDSFIELRSSLEFGKVNHALCAALREMLKEYQTLLSQLESAFNHSLFFSIQKLWYYIHPTVHTLNLLYQLISELGTANVELESSYATSSEDEEDEAKNEALGLGGAKLKAFMSSIKKKDIGVESNRGIAVKGGEVLTIIYERMQNMSGDPAARTLYASLLRSAGAPYVAMLKEWITTGRLLDPYEELCVKESRFINRDMLEMDYTDEYWDRRYTLRDGSTLSGPSKRRAGIPPPRTAGGRLPGGACIPPLLEGWKHKILLAGKYLNVIRECGIGMNTHNVKLDESELYMDDERLYMFIDTAYTHANHALLQLLTRDQQLILRLRSLKRYFFLSQSFFLTHLLDLSHTELRKSAKSASLVKLQSLLDLSLNTDVQGEDVMFREDVKVTMASTGLYEWLLKVVNVSGSLASAPSAGTEYVATPGGYEERKEKDDKKAMLAIDALTLDYQVAFPLSLVISRKTILRYQLLFRFLLRLRHVEQSLSAMWIEQKSASWRTSVPHHPEFEHWRLRVSLLRARMLAFVQQILAFATFEVLEPNWRALEAKLSKVTMVDQLLRDHVDFLDTCLKECMLTSSKLLKAYSKIMTTCAIFAVYASNFTKSASQAISSAENEEGDLAMPRRWDDLRKFETNFNHWFKVHLDCVQYYASSENVTLLPLVVRLDSIRTMS